MAVNNLNFGAQVDAWVRQTEHRMEAVFKESTQRVVSIANNRIPVDTGFARASVRASTEAMPQINNKATAGAVSGGSLGEISLVIAGARLGQVIYIGWTAAYVLRLEYGHSNQAPNGFVRLAAAQWQVTVGKVTEQLKAQSAVR